MTDQEFTVWLKSQPIGFLAMLYSFYLSVDATLTFAAVPPQITDQEIKSFNTFIQKSKSIHVSQERK